MNTRRALAILLAPFVLLALAGTARADDSLWSGYFLVYDYMDNTRVFDELGVLAREHPGKGWVPTDRAGLRLQLRLNQSFTHDVFVDATANIEYDVKQATRTPDASATDGMSVTFKEGYISLGRVLPWLDAKLGRQYVFWGRFEWGGALDVVSGWDFLNMGAEKENFRVAVDTARLSLDFSPLSVELLVVPVFTPNRVAFDLPDEMGPLAVHRRPVQIPGLGPEEVATGARVLVAAGGMGEIGLTWYRGREKNFSMLVEVVPDATTGFPSGLAFTQRYDRYQLFGLDFELALDHFMLMGESGFFLTPDDRGDDIFVRNRRLTSVLGFEWEPSSVFLWQSQVTYTRLFDYDRQREYDTREALGEPDPYVAGANQFGVTTKLQWRILPELSLHVLNLVSFPDTSSNDVMLLSFLSWEPAQALKLYGGSILFRGADDTRFGRIEDQGRFFLELKHSF
jgi:hypothetical protein